MDAEHQHLKPFLMANSITDEDMKRAEFLPFIGIKAYKLLGSLFASAKLGDKSYEESVKVMMHNSNPPPSDITERYIFHTAKKAGRVHRKVSIRVVFVCIDVLIQNGI